ncbi:MAG TPA: 16S rRNA (cytidine(1402)-2'-O)-methyltransferase [Gemmatimonadales bacterium]|nr:16S rRNA (cytidine(1402)-2'-O)-methyltransferase [Gemmatimonadales bacterium]
MDSGTLFIVATPLGNLGDLTPRAAETLRTVPVVAAEDTRRTRGLLTHLGASPRLISFHAHSRAARAESLLEILKSGRDVALVSDAGTPVISDPGSSLVQTVREAGIAVVPIPGVSAVATAVSVSGFEGDRYLFLGFAPRKGPERQRLLSRAAQEEWPVVFFEAPNRLAALLADLAELAGADRKATIARELTKIHEEIRTGTLGSLAQHYSELEPRGEITVVLDGTGVPEAPPDRTGEGGTLAQALLAAGLSRRDVVEQLTTRLGIARNEAYRMVMEIQ